jgi:hypothetical protein
LDVTQIWSLYQRGIEFKSSIDLYETVAKNERFFAGDQWSGVNAPDLPKPVINFLKRACQQKIADVKSNPTKVYFSPIEFPSAVVGGSENSQTISDDDTALLNALFEADWEGLKMDAINLDGLQDACISGDFILYNYWDATAHTGQAVQGQIYVEAIDNVNYYPLNPNEKDIQKQPGIIIARRELVSEVRREAERCGMANQVELIRDDDENYYQSGDMAKQDLYNAKCITLLYMYKDIQTGHIMAQKCTRQAVVRPLWDTRLTRYPLCMMNWELRKNCCHGRAEITGLIPVQRYINQMYAMSMLFTMQSACPKPLFNQSMIKAWSTAVGTAIPVNGDVNNAAKYLEPPALPQDAYSLPEKLMRTTLEMTGVSNLELGSFNPVNTSAIILAREVATAPLETIKARFYSMIEDFARNWLDMLFVFCNVPRWANVHQSGRHIATAFDAARLKSCMWSVKIDVGAGTLWSEAATVQTLNSLLASGGITAKQYIERLPEGYLPMREMLLRELGNN